jgi:hypothetical protein
MEKLKNKSKTDYFVKAFNSLLRNQEYLATEIRLFLILKSYAGKDDICFPSHKTLQSDMGLKETAIKALIKKLETLGAIYIVPQRKQSGRDTSNCYFLADVDTKTGKFKESKAILNGIEIKKMFGKVTVEGK